VCSLLVGSLILALTVVPVLASFALKGPITEKEEGWFASLRDRYRRSLMRALRVRPVVLSGAAAAVAVAIGSVALIGTEFMPKLDEGSILITTRKLPGIGLTESV